MNVDPNEKLAGVTMREIRRVFRLVIRREFSVKYLCERCRLPGEQGERLLGELLKRDLVQQAQGMETESYYTLTLKGCAVANANFGKRFGRDVGAKLIEAVRNRAGELNDDEWMPLFVEEIRIFGSWVTGSPYLGDIDLAVDFQRRYGNEYHIEMTEILVERNGYEGSFFDRLCYDAVAARRKLKGRDRRISIHDAEEFIGLGVESQQIFKAGSIARGNPAAMTDIQHN
jgi:predicted nucleotidyltransferase